jgi:hypothetical protein
MAQYTNQSSILGAIKNLVPPNKSCTTGVAHRFEFRCNRNPWLTDLWVTRKRRLRKVSSDYLRWR